jgi:hypothetical protein
LNVRALMTTGGPTEKYFRPLYNFFDLWMTRAWCAGDAELQALS